MPGTPRSGLAITDVRTRDYTRSLTHPFVTSRRSVEEIAGLLVEVELDDGTVGRGSAAQTLAVTGESVESMRAVLHGPITEVLTAEPADRGVRGHADAIATACAGNTSAKAAADVALHDAWARRLGVPLVEALGGDASAVLRTDMTVSLASPDAMARAATNAFDDGFTVLKIKLGHDWRADLDRLQAVRDAVPEAEFRLDANQGWDAKSAVRIIRAIQDAQIPLQLVEQPVPKHDLGALAAVTAAVDVPIMADEALNSPRDAFEIARAGAADVLNVKLAKCGGIGHALAIADVARAAGLRCMIGAMMEPRISITAAVHVAAAHPAITLVDLDSAEWIDERELAGGYALHGDQLHLSHAPGLGFGSESTEGIER
ncbi:dipeptide epimerase [Bounagaea algeriensis]